MKRLLSCLAAVAALAFVSFAVATPTMALDAPIASPSVDFAIAAPAADFSADLAAPAVKPGVLVVAVGAAISTNCRPGVPEVYSRPGAFCGANGSLAPAGDGRPEPARPPEAVAL